MMRPLFWIGPGVYVYYGLRGFDSEWMQLHVGHSEVEC